MSLEKQLVDIIRQAQEEKRLGDKRAEQFYDAIEAQGDLLAAHASRHELAGADQVDHDDLLNYAANEHINWTNTASNFLTTGTLGCGQLTAKGIDAGSVLFCKNTDNEDRLAINIASDGTPTGGYFKFYDYGGEGWNLGLVQYVGLIGIGKTPASPLDINLATEDLEIIDAGSAGATEQDWIEVEVGSVQGYIRVYATK